MWFATKQGLNSYNSYTFKHYFRQDYPGLSSDICNALLYSTDNKLYVGTDGGLALYQRETDNFTSLEYGGRHFPGITEMIETSHRNILAGTQKGLYIISLEDQSVSRPVVLENENITSLLEMEDGDYLAGTRTGLFIIGRNGRLTGTFNPDNTKSLPSELISCLFRDSEKNIWVGTEDHGVFLFDPEKKNFRRLPLIHPPLTGADFIRVIAEDDRKNLWIGTELGLFIYSLETGESVNIRQSLKENDLALNDNAVYTIYRSRENLMWLGTYFGGVNYTLLQNRKNFNHIYPGNGRNELRGKAVNRIFKSSAGLIWIATEDGGVCTYDAGKKEIVAYYQNHPGTGLSSNNIHSICEDKYGNIWLGNYTTGIDIFHPSSGKFTHVMPNPPDKQSITSNSIYALYTDSRGTLWVGTRINVKTWDYGKKAFVPFRPDVFHNIFIYNIQEDHQGDIWFCSRFHGIYRYSPSSGNLRHFSKSEGISSDEVIASSCMADGRMCFGTQNGGMIIYHPSNDSFSMISSADGLAGNTVYGILEDCYHNQWISTGKGLSKYTPETGRIKNYGLKDGLTQMQFNYGSYYKDTDGTMYFGHIGGLTWFNPATIRDNTCPPGIMLTNFKLFNDIVKPGPKSVLKTQIDNTDFITLRYSQNVFTIDYVAINYSSPGNNRFYYYLKGFDRGWNDVGNKTSLTYTNLSPGYYTMYLKAENNDGTESPTVRKLGIRILKPLYLSRAAIALYFILTILIILYFRRITIIREKEKAALNYEILEKKKIKELNQQRINFFTYISHEFKTPLSIILATIDELSETRSFNRVVGDKFERVKSAARRLSFLINQLMDFRKIETRHAKLELRKDDIIDYVRNICLGFTPIFEGKNLHFSFSSSHESSVHWFDPDKTEKIISNLLSNAVKFTPENGRITCRTEIREMNGINGSSHEMEIVVGDTGIGISDEDQKLLFTQFNGGFYGNEIPGTQIGTGLGLALVKSLVEFLQGSVAVRSKPGEGSEFIITLPLNYNQASNIVLQKNESPAVSNWLIHPDLYAGKSSEELKPQNDDGHALYHILVVEDTIDLGEILINHFNKEYKVSYAKNGLEALKQLRNEAPDLLICDIMMPGMNGIELCKKIKSDTRTSHIAVILLSARMSQEDRIEGLKAGAEAYLSKPFDFNELDLQVKNFLEIRKKMEKSLLIDSRLDPDKMKVHDRDKEFLAKTTSIINDNLGNELFSVKTLCKELGLSTTLVYLKFKKLLNISVKEYIVILRFKKAIEYMTTTDYSISEIAYMVGFSDPNYFSRAFRKTFKTSPTEYRNCLYQSEKLRDQPEPE